MYVADSGNNRIQKFDAGGNFLLKWGAFGTGNSQFKSPTDVGVDTTGNVYVTDAFNYRVKKFDSNGAFLAVWGSQGSNNGQFNAPYGIEVDASLGVLVSDSNNHRVQRFSTAGTFVEFHRLIRVRRRPVQVPDRCCLRLRTVVCRGFGQ